MSQKIFVGLFSLLLACGQVAPAYAATGKPHHKPHHKKVKKQKKVKHHLHHR
jgi:hypothetical protein